MYASLATFAALTEWRRCCGGVGFCGSAGGDAGSGNFVPGVARNSVKEGVVVAVVGDICAS